jgi:hypothetical protein
VARPIQNRPDFLRAVKSVFGRPPEQRPNLLGFFLFDERRSHQVVLEFARREFQWLNGLAAANRMVLFFFLPEGEAVRHAATGQPIEVADGTGTVANPSLYVAEQFGLAPSRLPGVVFFTQLDLEQSGPHEGVYSPLAAELFEGDSRGAEEAFSHLFGVVQEARSKAAEHTPLLEALQRQLESERRPELAGPGGVAIRVAELTRVVFDAPLSQVANLAFATGLGG